MPTVWVLCDVTDVSALWAVGKLQERGIRIELATAPALGAAATRWEHRIVDGKAHVEVTLPDGRVISSAEPVGVLNRLTGVPMERLARIGGADYDYAMQEATALYVSWLHALPGPVLNPPAPQGLSGTWRHTSVWAALATQAGLAGAPCAMSSDDDPASAWLPRSGGASVIVVGTQAVAPPGLDAEIVEGCIRLASAAQTPLLGIELAGDGTANGWSVASASPFPDLARGGDRLADV